ncbi:MAG: copper-binding protein [Pseudomonadota bacterium]|jgi:Cu/Ag efflux protein CusF
MKKTLLPILASIAAAVALTQPAMAADNHNHDMHPAPAKVAAAQTHRGEGKVNKVEADKNKINLTHGPIKSLGWAGMTMDFQVRDKAVLNGIKPGQQVEFEVVSEGPGQFYIIRITPLK